MTDRDYKARRYSRQCRERRRAKRVRIYRILLIAVLFAVAVLLCCLGACHEAPEAPVEPQISSSPQPISTPSPTSTPAPTPSPTPTPTPAPTAAPPVEEPVRHRDDIVTDGRLLSYECQELMQDICEEYEVPYALGLAMAEIETHFDPDAVSPTGDYGLMQINEINHGWLLSLGMDPMTHAGNIEAGIYIISNNIQAYGDIELALMAYNSGPGGAQRLWDAGQYHTDYSNKVMAAYERWTSILEG